jgi:hypothetical protein
MPPPKSLTLKDRWRGIDSYDSPSSIKNSARRSLSSKKKSPRRESWAS